MVIPQNHFISNQTYDGFSETWAMGLNLVISEVIAMYEINYPENEDIYKALWD